MNPAKDLQPFDSLSEGPSQDLLGSHKTYWFQMPRQDQIESCKAPGLFPKPKTEGIPEGMVCRILVPILLILYYIYTILYCIT